MRKLGIYLKEIREKLGYSLSSVYQNTAITNSKLSRIENGNTQEISPYDLKKLACLYNLDLIDLFIRANFLDEDDIKYHLCPLKGLELLNKNEKDYIQYTINFILSYKNKEI